MSNYTSSTLLDSIKKSLERLMSWTPSNLRNIAHFP